DAQVKPRSLAEEFIVKIARAVEEVMQREMVPLPQGTTIIPTEYTIFLSSEDDKEWQGVKRRGLEQGLYHILAERAKEIAGKKKLETKTFAVQLRVDGTLEKGEVRVQHSWEDDTGSKTSVLARPKIPTQQPQPKPPTPNNYPATPNFTPNPTFSANQPPPTVQANNFPLQNIPPTDSYQTSESAEEMTHVKKRLTELYRLEIWRGNTRETVVPVYKNEIVIGRGSKSKPVDIALAGDPEISRRHLILICDQAGNFSVLNEGRNPAMVNNIELPIGQRVSVSPGVPIVICSYLLRIQSRNQ
ncbi:MAG TPA: FhaA domain-containing protein, partial [Pyrinomonadaceae bacterium]|nr:FhaA domain-containing protein [Pyrinomonadaceae bacterium]